MLRPLLAAALCLLPLAAQAAPKADLWPRWQAHDADSTVAIDHGAWDALLQRYVGAQTRPHRFAYGQVSAADRDALKRYIADLEAVSISRYNRDEQMAYWINLYNAATIELVLAHYPVASITEIKISPGWFSFGPWGKKILEVEGQALSLNDIEHRILRPVYRDARIHYAVNCASLGCPDLQPEAYTGSNLEALLERGARAYVNHERGVGFDGDKLVVSSIYAWFAKDFGGSDAAVIAHLLRYAGPGLAMRLRQVKKISDDRYDWALNDTR